MTLGGKAKMNHEDLYVVFAVALGISESLALIPGLKSNGIIQMVINILKSLKGFTEKK
jgi:hypothetical protein